MTNQHSTMYSLQEAAEGYAAAAERLYGSGNYLANTPNVVPIFVSNLFQSLEISIKASGIYSGLFTMQEARRAGKGHGIQQLANLATSRLGGVTADLATAMCCGCPPESRTLSIISEMIEGDRFRPTRESHLSRRLAYAELSEGEIQILYPIPEWIGALKQTSAHLPRTISILRQWQASSNTSEHFAIWFNSKAYAAPSGCSQKTWTGMMST